MAKDPDLVTLIETLLLAAGEPLSLARMVSLFDDDTGVSQADVEAALTHLAKDCAGRGYELQEVASGYRFQVRPSHAHWIARLWAVRPQRYSRSLLETLAIIAYKQPVTRGDIEQIRGVTVSTQTVKTLLEREWIRAIGHREVPGRPTLYATTTTFLDYFNLASLDQLPPLAEPGLPGADAEPGAGAERNSNAETRANPGKEGKAETGDAEQAGGQGATDTEAGTDSRA